LGADERELGARLDSHAHVNGASSLLVGELDADALEVAGERLVFGGRPLEGLAGLGELAAELDDLPLGAGDLLLEAFGEGEGFLVVALVLGDRGLKRRPGARGRRGRARPGRRAFLPAPRAA